jgi:hypothetical protein
MFSCKKAADLTETNSSYACNHCNLREQLNIETIRPTYGIWQSIGYIWRPFLLSLTLTWRKDYRFIFIQPLVIIIALDYIHQIFIFNVDTFD